MAILLFGHGCGLLLALIMIGFNRLHGDSFIWTFETNRARQHDHSVSIAFMAILLFGRKPPGA